MCELTKDEKELVEIMSRLVELSYMKNMDFKEIRKEIGHKIAPILQEYYAENTRLEKTGRTKQLENSGITEDDGKTAISCARRLGINIS